VIYILEAVYTADLLRGEQSARRHTSELSLDPPKISSVNIISKYLSHYDRLHRYKHYLLIYVFKCHFLCQKHSNTQHTVHSESFNYKESSKCCMHKINSNIFKRLPDTVLCIFSKIMRLLERISGHVGLRVLS